MGLVMLRAGMKRTVHRRAAALAACAMAACAFFWSPEAHAQTSTSDLSRVLELIQQQESRLNEQERQLHEQQRQLSEQRSLIERQRREIEAMTSISDADLSEIRGAGAVRGGLAYEDLGPDEPIRVNQRPARTFLQSDSGGSAPPEATPTAAPQGPVGTGLSMNLPTKAKKRCKHTAGLDGRPTAHAAGTTNRIGWGRASPCSICRPVRSRWKPSPASTALM